MHILHLGLTNFRNYSRLELDLPPGIVLLQGDNAQGKTNLLEAIYYLSRMQSPRTNVDRELLNWLVVQDDLPFARLVARVEKAGETEQIELALVQGNEKALNSDAVSLRKHIRINGANKRALDAIGLLNVVLFLPQDIELVAGAPHLRRRYLDDTICQIDAQYYHALQQYSRVLTQRNSLLKSLRDRGGDPAQLLFWDQHLVEHGAYLTIRRQEVLQKVDQAVQQIHARLTGEKEHLRLEYCASIRTTSQPGTAYQIALLTELKALPKQVPAHLHDVAASFTEQLHQVRPKELEQGMSIIGPHRDDFRFVVDGVDMNTYGSRGQQRTVALSLKLAEVELLTQEKKDKPVLLLDDVISELDATHRACLFEAIDQSQQVIITTTDLTHYDEEFLARATLWLICAGRITEMNTSSQQGDYAPLETHEA